MALTEILEDKKLPKPSQGSEHVNDEAINFEFEHFSFFIRRDRLEELGIVER